MVRVLIMVVLGWLAVPSRWRRDYIYTAKYSFLRGYKFSTKRLEAITNLLRYYISISALLLGYLKGWDSRDFSLDLAKAGYSIRKCWEDSNSFFSKQLVQLAYGKMFNIFAWIPIAQCSVKTSIFFERWILLRTRSSPKPLTINLGPKATCGRLVAKIWSGLVEFNWGPIIYWWTARSQGSSYYSKTVTSDKCDEFHIDLTYFPLSCRKCNMLLRLDIRQSMEGVCFALKYMQQQIKHECVARTERFTGSNNWVAFTHVGSVGGFGAHIYSQIFIF